MARLVWFPSTWAIIWNCKPNKAFPPQLPFGHDVYHSSRRPKIVPYVVQYLVLVLSVLSWVASAYVHIHECLPMCVGGRGWCWASSSTVSLPCVLRHDLSLILQLTNWLNWLASKPPGFLCQLPLGDFHIWDRLVFPHLSFTWVLRIRALRSLCSYWMYAGWSIWQSYKVIFYTIDM